MMMMIKYSFVLLFISLCHLLLCFGQTNDYFSVWIGIRLNNVGTFKTYQVNYKKDCFIRCSSAVGGWSQLNVLQISFNITPSIFMTCRCSTGTLDTVAYLIENSTNNNSITIDKLYVKGKGINMTQAVRPELFYRFNNESLDKNDGSRTNENQSMTMQGNIAWCQKGSKSYFSSEIDPTPNFVNIPLTNDTIFTNLTEFTYSMWFKYKPSETNSIYLINISPNYYFYLFPPTTQLVACPAADNEDAINLDPTAFTFWTNIISVTKKDVNNIYINGTLVRTRTLPRSISTLNPLLKFGFSSKSCFAHAAFFFKTLSEQDAWKFAQTFLIE